MKILLILSIACCCVAIAGCSGDAGNANTAANTGAVNANQAANGTASNSASNTAYPQTTVDAFLESCQEAGSDETFCSCVFEKVRANYSFEEFSVIESQIIAGTPPEEFVEFTEKARAECTKE